MTKAAVLDTSLQRTHEWLHQISDELGFDNERAAYAALRATLHAIRDRLPVELVAHFAAQLPMLVRGIYFEGWHPSADRLRAAHAENFADAMRRGLQGHGELQDVERAARAVLSVVDRRIDPGEIAHVLEALPRPVRLLWQDVRQAAAD